MALAYVDLEKAFDTLPRKMAHEEGIGDYVRLQNTFASPGESMQDSCKTSNDVRCRDVGSE